MLSGKGMPPVQGWPSHYGKRFPKHYDGFCHVFELKLAFVREKAEDQLIFQDFILTFWVGDGYNVQRWVGLFSGLTQEGRAGAMRRKERESWFCTRSQNEYLPFIFHNIGPHRLKSIY
jgi:hypothetical protein